MSVAEIANSVPQYEKKRSSLNRKRLNNIPVIPTVLDQLNFENLVGPHEILKQTIQKKRFFLLDCIENGQRIVIYASDLQLEILCQSKTIGADGTFKICPSIFQQLYIIVGLYKGQAIPCAYILLSSKLEVVYKRMLKELKDACLVRGLEFRPDFVILDFEQSAINAFKYSFPLSSIVGQLVALGLKVQYGSDPELKKMFKKCIALALMPTHKVVDVFVNYILDYSYDLIEKYPQFNAFLDYITEVWIDETSLYKIALWNHWDNLTRTNNSNESYNFRLEQRYPKNHPNIWSFIQLIQNEEGNVVFKVARIDDNSIKTRSRKKVDADRDLAILRAKVAYLESSKNEDDLEILLHKLHLIVPDF